VIRVTTERDLPANDSGSARLQPLPKNALVAPAGGILPPECPGLRIAKHSPCVPERSFPYIRTQVLSGCKRKKGMADQETFPCQICGEQKRKNDLVPAALIRASIIDIIVKEHPSWSPEGYICYVDLNRFRIDYVRDVIKKEKDEYVLLEETVKHEVKGEDHLPENINVEFEKELTFGERLADRFADFAGSWTFIAIFSGIFFVWIVMNSIVLVYREFDPYPFILLNLVLSALAAIQAPVIIMSQNRQEMRDRLHAERDYQVSIHTELEIHRLHKKIDHLLTSQEQRLLEIQNIQVELMEDLAKKTS
jgi:uncharacterized membrane protein